MSKVRILSPRPENSNRRICGGFNFLFGTCGFERQNFCQVRILYRFVIVDFNIGIYKSCLMFYNGVGSNGFIGFGAVVARRRDICR